MYRETVQGKWQKEPICPSTGSLKPDGTYGSYFCHLVYDGAYERTVLVDELFQHCWKAAILDYNGEQYHIMSAEYSTNEEAFQDAIDWNCGQ